MKSLLLSIAVLFGIQSTSWASTIRFSELGTLSLIDVNGIYLQGVLFGFSPDQAWFNQEVGTAGNAVLSVDPVLAGPTSGVLSLTFDTPTPLLQFDIILQSIFTIDDSALGANGGPAYTVRLSDGTVRTGATTPLPGGVYSEGEFLYEGPPVTSAEISFFTGVDAGGTAVGAFGLDNLTTTAVPEPATFLILGAGLLAVGLRKRRNL